jgi:outer membrane protein assembly factor BamB
MPRRARLLWIVLAAASLHGLRAGDWPQFRGPTGLGYTTETELPVSWSGASGENVLWKSPLTGEGHASPIVRGERVFVCTVRWGPDVKDRTRVIPEHHVLAYSARDGRPLWDTLVPPGPWLRDDFRSGPGGGYAAPTPCTDGRLVFAVFGSSVIAALDFEGKIAWRKEIIPYTFDVTIGSSPILFGDTVILLCAMAKKQDSRIVGFEKASGAVRWETPLPETSFGHSTPIVIDVRGQPQMVIAAGGMSTAPEALQSFDPATGKRIWWCEGSGEAASPAFGAGILYADSGRGGPGRAIDPTGEGNVTATHVRWKVPQVPEGIGSPIIVDGRIYRLHEPGVLKCWQAADGRQVAAQRLEGVTTTWASPIADAASRVFFASAGKSFVIQAGPEPRIIATNDLGDPNHASPAVAGGRMYLLGTKSLYCIGRK